MNILTLLILSANISGQAVISKVEFPQAFETVEACEMAAVSLNSKDYSSWVPSVIGTKCEKVTKDE